MSRRRMTTAEFIERARKIHPTLDYSKSVYRTAQVKISISCPEHGLFRQIASNHIHHGNGCPECAIANKTRIIIKPGQRFGELRATGVTATTVAGKRRKRVRTEQVVCPHGVIKFIRLVDLRRGWTRSCRQWAECSSAAKANEVFGELKATGNHKRVGTNKTAEVICSHGNTQFVFLSKLRSGKTKGCSHWPKCSAAKVGEIFGRLVATGENRQGRRALAQVVCPHGVSKFVLLASLRRSVHTTRGCRLWPECRPTRGEAAHRVRMRSRTPKVDKRALAKLQGGVCIVCGNVRRKAKPDSKEHIITINWSVRKKTWRLETKQTYANSELNIGLSHRWCNVSRNYKSLVDYWTLHPEYEAPAKIAIGGLFSRLRNIEHKDFPLVREILKQVGFFVKDDSKWQIIETK